jgi:hypothetical protein
MKADVFPALPGLDIPSWVPEPIAQCARDEYAADVEPIYQAYLKENGWLDDVPDDLVDQISRELVRDDVVARTNLATDPVVQDELAEVANRYWRLVCDPRMEGVWRYLSRRIFLHPACGLSQDAALIELFKTTLACQHERGATMTRDAIEQERDRSLAKAEELRNDAFTMLGGSDGMERFRALRAAAQALEDSARESYANSVATSLERKHDGPARWVALTISDKLRELFDSSMYGVTAIIASVILGRKIKPRSVQQWVGYPAVKPPKIAP